AGAVTVKVPTRALRVVGRGEGSTPSPRPSASQPSPMRDEGRVRGKTKAEVGPELHLIGRTADEARETLEKYLDDAFLAGLPTVRIIHGQGTGTLPRAGAGAPPAPPRAGRGARPPARCARSSRAIRGWPSPAWAPSTRAARAPPW